MSGNDVDLGFLEPCEPWLVESRLFPSKTGGKPAWLNLENVPTSENLQCSQCKKVMIFLCQIYAPYENDDNNFHRTIYIFICKTQSCCTRNSSSNIKAFRSNLKRQNKFYSYDPPEEEKTDFNSSKWANFCNLCGCKSDKKCSKCKSVHYCSKEHQISDWKEGHKIECEKSVKSFRISKKLFPQWEIVIEPEELKSVKNDNIEEELENFARLQAENKTGTMQNLKEDDFDKYTCTDQDKTFLKFRKRIQDYPDHVVRYDKGGLPLYIAENPKPEDIPNCEYCGSVRQFEFQIMPQMLALLKENELDWGVILIYTCATSCSAEESYKNEFIFKQDVAF